MIWTVISTVLSGVTIYIFGQLVLKLVIEPVQEARKTIAQISHSFIEYGSIIHTTGVSSEDKISETSQHLKKLAAQLHSHLFLVPCYRMTASVFGLPAQNKILTASKQLMALSNSIFSKTDDIHRQISKRREKICDLLGIYFPADERWPTE